MMSSGVIVIETSLLVDLSRGGSNARAYIDPLMDSNVAWTHPLSNAELLVGARDRAHLNDLLQLLTGFRRLSVRASDVEQALNLIEEFHLSHRLGWPDAIIGATCSRLGVPVATLNERDFRLIPGLRVIRPY